MTLQGEHAGRNNLHKQDVHPNRRHPEPVRNQGRPPQEDLVRGSARAPQDHRQPLRPRSRRRRRLPRRAQGRARPRRPPQGLRDPPLASPRPCRRRSGHDEAARLQAPPRAQEGAEPGPRARRRRRAPILFEDDDREGARAQRSSPVEPARAKAADKRTPDGLPVHSLTTLLADLATLTLNEATVPAGPDHGFPV